MQLFLNVLKVVDFLLSQVLSVVLFRVGIGKAIFGSCYYWRLDLSPDYRTHLIGDDVHALIKLVN